MFRLASLVDPLTPTRGIWCYNEGSHLESEQQAMSDEPANPVLEQLTEETAEAIVFTIGATPGDPKPAVMWLLRRYLADVQEQEFETARREKN